MNMFTQKSHHTTKQKTPRHHFARLDESFFLVVVASFYVKKSQSYSVWKMVEQKKPLVCDVCAQKSLAFPRKILEHSPEKNQWSTFLWPMAHFFGTCTNVFLRVDFSVNIWHIFVFQSLIIMCSTRALISCTYFFHPSKTRKVIQENAKLHTKYLKNTWFCKVFCVEKMSTTLSLALFDEHFMHFISGKWHETSATTPYLRFNDRLFYFGCQLNRLRFC